MIFPLINLLLVTLARPTTPSNLGDSFSFEELSPLRQSSIGQICKPPLVACADPNAVCRRKPSHLLSFCKCSPGYFFDRKFGKCTRSIAIGGPCSESRECQSFDRHSYCDYGQLLRNRESICVCQSKYVYNHEKGRCVHCRSTLADCRDPSPTSAHSIAKYKFALLIKIILIVVGFFLLLSLTFCFFIKILTGYNKNRRARAAGRTSASIVTTTATSGRGDVQVYISAENCRVENGVASSARVTNDEETRPFFSFCEDKPPSYEEAVLGTNVSSQGKRNLIISLTPTAPSAGNLV